MKDQNLRAAEQCGVEFKARILGRRANEDDRAILNIGQETILLRAVETVDFINE